jgi:hypothetical protein
MPHKDPAVRRLYEKKRYRAMRAKRRAQIDAWKRAVFARDPEAMRAKWRQYRATGRARAALRELERIKAEKQPRRIGYKGALKPKGF